MNSPTTDRTEVERDDVVAAIEGGPAASRRALRKLGLASVEELLRVASRVKPSDQTTGPVPARFCKPFGSK